LQVDLKEHLNLREIVTSIQNDMWNRFSFARIGQIVDEQIRQIDIVYRDRANRFVILCPETDQKNSRGLAERITSAIETKTGMHVLWSVAAFPEDAINFEDLLGVATSKLTHPPVLEQSITDAITHSEKVN
jgi:GGDEF domain-containing protein